MAQATNTTLGQILIAGDLHGSGSAPELVNSGVDPKSYKNVRTIHVDTKGRITWANGTLTYDYFQPYMQDATESTRGYMQIGAPNQGYKLDATSGTISFTYPDASATQKGIVKPGLGLSISNGSLAADYSTLQVTSKSSKGTAKIGQYLQVNSGVISIDNAQLPVASSTVKGLAQVGTGFDVSSGVISVNYGSIAATTSTLGLVQPSGNIKITAGGSLYADYTDATGTTSAKGLVTVGNNITVTSGSISVADATTTTKGVFKIGDGIAQGARSAEGQPYDGVPGKISLDRYSYASSTTAGLVKAGWSTGVTGTGVMNLSPGFAAINWKGIIMPGTGFGINPTVPGQIIVTDTTRKAASTTSLGLVKIDTSQGLAIAADGTLSYTVPTNLTDASTSVKGVVQVGSGLSIDGSQSLSIPYATTSTRGVVKIGSGVHSSLGTIDIPYASTSTFGIVRIDNGSGNTHGFSLSSGILSATYPTQATTGYKVLDNTISGTFGSVKVTPGNGLSISDGTLSFTAVPATSSTVGTVKVDGTTTDMGFVEQYKPNVIYFKNNTAYQRQNEYTVRTKTQFCQPATANNAVSQITLAEDCDTTIFNISNANGTSYTLPSGTLTTNPPIGTVYRLIIIQDATGGASITPSSVLGTTINTAATTITYIKYVVKKTNTAVPVSIMTGV